jgi:hypothetical protein
MDDVRRKSFQADNNSDIDVSKAKDIDTLLETAKDGLATSEARRSAVIDKCKSLLTMGSLFLGLIAFLLPKDLIAELLWMRVLIVITLIFFVHAVVILLLFLVVGTEMEVKIDQAEIELSEPELKKSLLHAYLSSRRFNDYRTDYLVEVFKVARFSFFASFLSAMTVLGIAYIFYSPANQTQTMIKQLKSDSQLINLLRGPKGDPGPRGPTGSSGPRGKDASSDIDALAKSVANLIKIQGRKK